MAERTVSRLLPTRRRPPSQTWRTFLANHVRDLVGLDFFTVPTAGLRVLFVLVVLTHDRRRVVHFNVNEYPTAAWTAQQIVDTFPDDSASAYLLRDRDPVYGERRSRRAASAPRPDRVLRLLSSHAHSPLARQGRTPRTANRAPELGGIIRIPEVGGLHHRYVRRVA